MIRSTRMQHFSNFKWAIRFGQIRISKRQKRAGMTQANDEIEQDAVQCTDSRSEEGAKGKGQGRSGSGAKCGPSNLGRRSAFKHRVLIEAEKTDYSEMQCCQDRQGGQEVVELFGQWYLCCKKVRVFRIISEKHVVRHTSSCRLDPSTHTRNGPSRMDKRRSFRPNFQMFS